MFEPRWRLPEQNAPIGEVQRETGEPSAPAMAESRGRGHVQSLLRLLILMQIVIAMSIILQVRVASFTAMGWLDVINGLALLGPIVLLVLVRRINGLVILSALIIIPVCLGRLYYFVRYLDDGYSLQMGDWATWVGFVFGYATLCIDVLVVSVRSLRLVFEGAQRAIRFHRKER